jgi:hypothetical protein
MAILEIECRRAMVPAIVTPGDVHLILFFVLFVFIIVVTAAVRRRSGRSTVLEQWIAQGKCGPITSFEGTLAVEQAGQGFLRLVKNEEASRLQFRYRWLSAIREQAGYDVVVFDNKQHVVELTKQDKVTRLPFGKFSAIRMRELSQQEAGSLWHFDLVEAKGKYVLFLSSARGNRRMMFENSAGLAKTISLITSLPVQVELSRHVWTPGWPPEG